MDSEKIYRFEVNREMLEISVDCWAYAFNKPRPQTEFMTFDDLQLFVSNLMNSIMKSSNVVKQRADDFISAKLEAVSDMTQEWNMN